jgi:hypothetical protein
MKPNEKGLPRKPFPAPVKPTEIYLWTTTDDEGSVHTVEQGTTFWDDFDDADANARECNGVVLGVRVQIRSVHVAHQNDYRRAKVAGYVVISCDEEIVSYGKERADAILAFNKLNPRHPFGVGSETVWPAGMLTRWVTTSLI